MMEAQKLYIITNTVPHYNHAFYDSVSNKLKGSYEVHIWTEESTSTSLHISAADPKYTLHKNRTLRCLGLAFRPGLLWVLLKEKPSKVVFYGNPRDISVFLGLVVANLVGSKTYSYGMFHRIGRLGFKTRLIYKIFALLSNRCLTYGLKGAHVLYALGIKREKIHVVGTAVELEPPKSVTLVKTANNVLHTRNYGLNDCQIVLQVVRFSKIKRIDILIEAASLIKNNNTKFVLIGNGETFNEISNLIMQRNMQDRFILLGAIYEEEILANWFHLADVCVVPSCIGLSLHHAFAYSKPVISDDCIETQSSEFELLKDGTNGLTYEAGNAEDLAQKITYLLSNRTILKDMGVNALKTYHDNSVTKKATNFIAALGLDNA